MTFASCTCEKDGSVRFYVDFRNLNALTVADSYPLPPVQQMLDELNDSTIFTSLDARSAYWAILVAPDDRSKTAFSDGARVFQFCRMPYGLRTAPQTFQHTINLVLALGKHTAAYLDDIVVFSRGLQQHLQDLKDIRFNPCCRSKT